MFKKGDLCKHFKGTTLEEKNIYEILEMGVKYSGDASENPIENLVIYKNIFQGKIFARELKDLIEELPADKQAQYGQVHRVEKLTEEEIKKVKARLKALVESER